MSVGSGRHIAGVRTVAVGVPGEGYKAGDVLTLIGGDDHARVTVERVTATGGVAALRVTTAGVGYETNVHGVMGGSGQNATVNVLTVTSGAVGGGGTGAVKTVLVAKAGAGYKVHDVLTLLGGNDEAKVKVDSLTQPHSVGGIATVHLTVGGQSYKTGVYRTAGGTGTGAEIDVVTIEEANDADDEDEDETDAERRERLARELAEKEAALAAAAKAKSNRLILIVLGGLVVLLFIFFMINRKRANAKAS